MVTKAIEKQDGGPLGTGDVSLCPSSVVECGILITVRTRPYFSKCLRDVSWSGTRSIWLWTLWLFSELCESRNIWSLFPIQWLWPCTSRGMRLSSCYLLFWLLFQLWKPWVLRNIHSLVNSHSTAKPIT